VKIDVSPVPLEEILSLRDLYRQEMNCQIVHDSLPRRGFGDLYLIRVDGRVAGYGFVMGYHGQPKDTIREFYVLPAYRAAALPLFQQLIAVSQARLVTAQTNDVLLTLMLFDCTNQITSETILFHDACATSLSLPSATVREVAEADKEHIFPHHVERVGEYLIEHNRVIVATGGIALHYNPPYGDLYMEVDQAHRRRGYGSYLIQELKRVCYEMGRIPAARCHVANTASRTTLQKAGLLPCARIVSGVLAAGSTTGPP
jgi:GNAT superfamily N-acetyltransferase